MSNNGVNFLFRLKIPGYAISHSKAIRERCTQLYPPLQRQPLQFLFHRIHERIDGGFAEVEGSARRLEELGERFGAAKSEGRAVTGYSARTVFLEALPQLQRPQLDRKSVV